MSRFLITLSILLALTGIAIAQQSAPKAPKVDIKKAMTQARAALDAGQPQQAQTLYQSVLTSNARDLRRYEADALYGLALSLLRPGQSAQDTEQARTALVRMTQLTPPDHRHDAAVLTLLLQERDDADKSRKAADDRAQQVERASADVTARLAEQRSLAQDLQTKLDALTSGSGTQKVTTDRLRAENRSLQDQLTSLHDQLSKTQSELAKKDAALKKIASGIVKK